MRYSSVGLVVLLSLSFDHAIHAQPATSSPLAATVLPSGTQLALAVIRPVWAASAKPGDPLYTQTTFPVVAGNTMVIPSGSYVAGQIDAITRPARRSNHASLTARFTAIILANGYVIPLTEALPAQVLLDIQASAANDLLLDNGAQIELTLTSPLSFDAARAAEAIPLSKPIEPGHFVSATKCRPTPPTSGTSDTVFPGSPGSPGTPDTVIPGINGGPPTIIPGIPATPGTPATVIPGSPGSPGSACPAPPLVLSSTNLNAVSSQSSQLTRKQD